MVNFKDEIAKLIAEKVEGLELSEIQDMIERSNRMVDQLFERYPQLLDTDQYLVVQNMGSDS